MYRYFSQWQDVNKWQVYMELKANEIVEDSKTWLGLLCIVKEVFIGDRVCRGYFVKVLDV